MWCTFMGFICYNSWPNSILFMISAMFPFPVAIFSLALTEILGLIQEFMTANI